jgi:hypothetical protein
MIQKNNTRSIFCLRLEMKYASTYTQGSLFFWPYQASLFKRIKSRINIYIAVIEKERYKIKIKLRK